MTSPALAYVRPAPLARPKSDVFSLDASPTIPYNGRMTEPSYLSLHASGELAARARTAWALLAACELCPHRCGVDRLAGERGRCRMGDRPKVSSWTLHAWEEPPISGTRGSGTIFFSGCTGRCLFCQNYPISQLGHGQEVSVERLAGMMIELQRRGAHNINFVTPTHFMPHILAALLHALRGGFHLPLVYNTSGYERVLCLAMLEGVVDIWLPDAKYADDQLALKLSGFPDYVAHNRAALREICRQTGGRLELDGQGLASRGMIIRHLVLPGGLSGTPEVLGWIAEHLSRDVHISLMDQYFPAHRALRDSRLNHKLSLDEYYAAQAALDAAGLYAGWCQDSLEQGREPG